MLNVGSSSEWRGQIALTCGQGRVRRRTPDSGVAGRLCSQRCAQRRALRTPIRSVRLSEVESFIRTFGHFGRACVQAPADLAYPPGFSQTPQVSARVVVGHTEVIGDV